MSTNRNTKRTPSVPVQFRAPRQLVDSFREVLAGEERTLSQDLRRYMAQRVVEQEADREPESDVAA